MPLQDAEDETANAIGSLSISSSHCDQPVDHTTREPVSNAAMRTVRQRFISPHGPTSNRRRRDVNPER